MASYNTEMNSKMFLYTHDIDVKLISETHLTEKSYIRIPQYTLYHTNHPAGTAQGGTAIILKYSIQHHPLNPYNQAFLQTTSVASEDTASLLTISLYFSLPNTPYIKNKWKNTTTPLDTGS
jgi:hypothetical protein